MSGRAITPGTARGLALVLDEPLSLWGGLDPATGHVIEPRHPQHGSPVSGRSRLRSANTLGSSGFYAARQLTSSAIVAGRSST